MLTIISHHRYRTDQVVSKFRRAFELCPRCRHRFYSTIEANDIVLLKKKGSDTAKPILTKQIQPTGKVYTHQDSIDHASLIGKEIRDTVSSKNGVIYRIHQPSLAEYVTLSPRIVTPVYPADANLIVSLLDIHPPINPKDHLVNEPFEIFEAGTGHGALTLHLARAIHGLNPSPPPLPPLKSCCKSSSSKQEPINLDAASSIHATSFINKSSTGELMPKTAGIPSPNEDTQSINEFSTEVRMLKSSDIPIFDQATQTNKHIICLEHELFKGARYEDYLHSRRAVIHTLDTSSSHSKFAQSVVRGFRRGIYYHNIDFHVGTILAYLSSRLVSTPEPFLEHAILDLPNAQEHLEIVSRALKPNGILIVFCPSVTQIADCVLEIREKKLPFIMESALELGAGVGVGGREWDVRVAKPRALLKARAKTQVMKEQGDATSEPNPDSDEQSLSIASVTEGSEWVTVCRPKVGERVYGGGFLGLWRRMKRPPTPELGQVPTQATNVI